MQTPILNPDTLTPEESELMAEWSYPAIVQNPDFRVRMPFGPIAVAPFLFVDRTPDHVREIPSRATERDAEAQARLMRDMHGEEYLYAATA